MKNKKVLIFGITDLAKMLYHFIQQDENYELCAFVVEKEYLPADSRFFNIPIIEFETLLNTFSPD